VEIMVLRQKRVCGSVRMTCDLDARCGAKAEVCLVVYECDLAR
jgi:hypothetical protein